MPTIKFYLGIIPVINPFPELNRVKLVKTYCTDITLSNLAIIAFYIEEVSSYQPEMK